MSRITETFKDKKAFIGFVTCGDPDLETTEKVVAEMAKNGADVIELGIPFSDPTAEGPVIQAASLRALKGGATTDKIFEMTKRLSKTVSVPMVFMTYANVVFSYGTEKFAEKCREANIAGIILPDVPYEEKEEFSGAFNKCGMDFISLIAPTSHRRITMIAEKAQGFLYCVSSMGVTGVRKEITTNIGEMTDAVKRVNKDIPCAVGFGISTPEQAKEMVKHADGVIVGSAIVKIVAEYGKDAAKPVGKYVKTMKDAINE